MADVGYEMPATGIVGRVTNWLGAGSAVALVLGLSAWSYQLTMRDVSGVPVVRALEGPSRVQPDDPGGQLAEHQGLAVNTVQAEGEAEGPAPQVILAPPAIDLAAEDAMVSKPAVQEIEVSSTKPVPDAAPEAAEVSATPEESVEEIVQVVQEGTFDLSSAIEAAVGEALTGSTSERIDPSIPGVKASPRPNIRPRIERAVLRRNAPAAKVEELDPASIEDGTRLVQLGTFDDPQAARAAWDTLAIRFDDYMTDKARVIQESESGGKPFYRLRAAGFDDLSAARRFCVVLAAENANCIPALAR